MLRNLLFLDSLSQSGNRQSQIIGTGGMPLSGAVAYFTAILFGRDKYSKGNEFTASQIRNLVSERL